MERSTVSKATLSRLPEYLKTLKEIDSNETSYISATTLAKMLNMGEVKVRKDLAAVSGAGRPKLGYEVVELINKIEQTLGYNQLTHAVLVGAGKLGRALMQYEEFKRFGVEITAAFDSNDQVIRIDNNTRILPMGQFKQFCQNEHIKLGIITVGEGSAQEVCDKMVNSGIVAIWNFAPCKLNVPPSILLENENLALSLAYLNNQLYK